MDNILDNGTVLPSGLLSQQGMESAISAFNRSYRNTGLKAGIVVKSYAPTDPFNQNGLCTEYDVQVMEQFENKGSAPILYRNCISTQGFGSLADYLEFTLRPKTFQTQKGFPTFGDQDGAVVLLQCLDGDGAKAVVVGSLIHPDRDTNITSNAPQMSGEYNGVNIEIENDGSCSLTFKGATDSKGVPTDPTQGNTVLQIQTDGSFQFNHSTITIRADRSGVLTITTASDTDMNVSGNTNMNTALNMNINVGQNTNVNIVGNLTAVVGGNANATIKGNLTADINGSSQVKIGGNSSVLVNGSTTITTLGDTNINTSGIANIIAQGTTTIDGSTIKLGVSAIEAVIKGNTFAALYDNHFHYGNLGVPTSGPNLPMDPALSTHVFTE